MRSSSIVVARILSAGAGSEGFVCGGGAIGWVSWVIVFVNSVPEGESMKWVGNLTGRYFCSTKV